MPYQYGCFYSLNCFALYRWLYVACLLFRETQIYDRSFEPWISNDPAIVLGSFALSLRASVRPWAYNKLLKNILLLWVFWWVWLCIKVRDGVIQNHSSLHIVGCAVPQAIRLKKLSHYPSRFFPVQTSACWERSDLTFDCQAALSP